MVVVTEGLCIVLHGLYVLGVLIEVGQVGAYAFGHGVGLDVVPHEGMSSGYFGQTGEGCDEDGSSELHGFDDGQAESLALAWEEEGVAVGIEPDALCVGDLACEQYIGEVFVGYALTNVLPGVEVVVAADVEIVVGKMLHHVEQQMEVLFPSNLPDGEEEGLMRAGKGRLGLWFLVDAFDGIVDDLQFASAEVEVRLNFVCHEL